MKWNRLLKSLLKTTVYILDQTAEQVNHVADRTSEITDQAKRVVDSAASAIQPRKDHTLRNIVSFAAGVGIGVGAGMLLAPASGGETRSSISEKIKDIGNKVKGRLSTQDFATGTD
jgi:gas vesicle protein